ncbi:LOW QUALITY PROTEIN: E3 ubiquitin-protein ligase TTC3 [Trichechus inunguis]
MQTLRHRSALGDGKRATVLKSTWPKGHYRYCDALSLLGEHDWALKANIKAQELCKNDPEGLKELIQQHIRFQKQIDELQGRTRGRGHFKRGYYDSRDYIPLSVPSFCASLNFVDIEKGSTNTALEMASGGRRNRKFHYHGQQGAGEASKGNDDDEEELYECRRPSNKPPRHKGRHRSRNNAAKASPQVAVDLKHILERELSKSPDAAQQDFVTLMKMLKGLIQDGYTALLDKRCLCVQAFTHLLNGLDPQKIKQLNLAMINYVLVVYGLGLSLLGIGRPEELSEAENQFRQILALYPNEGLDCLAYCGIGSVYLKRNRFSEALSHFQTARNVISRLLGVLTWPTSNVVIEETRPSKIRALLERFIEECKFPPVPEGICSYHDHCGSLKIQIYVTDPDFKGFIRILCSQICKIEFHVNCWKKLKATSYGDKHDKDFLNASCLTPDCQGVICRITVFNSKGGVKCEFEHKVIKEKVPPRPILKQKCSSLEKLKEKEEKKLKRKIQKEEAKKLAKERLEEDLRESNPPQNEEKKAVENAQACQFFDDRILQCIKQYSENIKSGILNTSTLMKELLSWKVLSVEDYTTCFSSRNFLSEAVDFVIQHLIKENNRVKTRIFLHVLNEHKEIEPKVASWIEKLNGFGLTAAGSFLTRHEASLKDLDFTILSILWNEKYGHKLGSIEGKKLEYFYEPTSLKEARCLIWLLEDHREKFPAMHSALDEFFDLLDSSCTVLRKQDNNDSMYVTPKAKHKGKKKKPKDLKPMLVGSGTPSVIPSVKSETVTSGSKNKGSSHSSGPFAVPEHLRKDIEEFEAYYKKRQQRNNEYDSQNKKMGEANPKQKCSTLYDYFSQYLEDNGPLDIRHRVFNEYRFYPEETRQIVQKAGGLRQFLLRCPRFVVIDNCIALRKVSTRIKRKRKKKVIKEEVDEISSIDDEMYLPFFLSLHPDTREFTPESGSSSAPASEDVMPKPVSADSPNSACKDVKPELASGDFSRPVAADGEPKCVSSDSPQPVSEDANHTPVSSQSPKPASEDVKPTYWAQPRLVTGYYPYLPYQGFDITQSPPAYINMLSSMPQYAGIYTPLATISEYQLQGAIPVVPSFVAHDRPDPNAAAAFEGHHVNAENTSGNRIASETQILQGSLETSVKSHCGLGDADTALKESSRNDSHGGRSAKKGEGSRVRMRAVAAHPPTQMAAVQVSWDVAHQEVNTEPYERFEAEPGDISRMEKEYRKLQEKLENAYEKYEQTRFKGLAEIRDLEEKLKRNSERCQVSKTELEWFIQDLEKETKKWQQEKKETQEKVKALKKKVRRLSIASETCTQKNDEKDEEHGLHLDESLEIRNPFANEKAKLEERIKKSKENYEEVHERAVAAEVSVLTCWKDIHVWKLEVTKTQGEAYVECLKSRRSDHEPYLVDAVLYEWESYFASVEEELETIDSQLEDKVDEVKSGTWVSEITKVLSLPVFDKYRPESSRPDGQQTAVHKDASASPEKAPAEESEVARLLACAKKAVQAAQSKQSPGADQKPPCPQGRGTRSNQSLKKPFNSIIEHLAAVFPCYSSSELAGFVKKVRTKSSLLGLSIDETVGRVIEHILTEQKKKPNPGTDQRTSEPSSAAPATKSSGSQPSAPAGASPKTQGQKQEDGSAVPVTASSTNACEMCHQALKSKNTCVLKCGHKFHTWVRILFPYFLMKCFENKKGIFLSALTLLVFPSRFLCKPPCVVVRRLCFRRRALWGGEDAWALGCVKLC